MIYVLGADHGSYVKRLKEAVARPVSGGDAQLAVIYATSSGCFRDGEPVRCPKRAGEFVTLREVVDEVGPDAVRFMMLFRKNTSRSTSTSPKVAGSRRQSGLPCDMPARCHSVFRQARAFRADATSRRRRSVRSGLPDRCRESR
ncbi:MAG: hypothetical protein H6891_11500 [Brucellaceae bacterium]|nr:hypothetical protein [Brucellaceae bacterium]